MDSKVTKLVTPEGWVYENSLSAKFQFVEFGHVPEFMDFLRHENDLDVYQDLRPVKKSTSAERREANDKETKGEEA